MTQPADPASPTRKRGEAYSSRLAKRSRIGLIFLVAGCVLLVGMGLTPAPYVIRQPGPALNALGDVSLEEGADPVSVIKIDGAESYEPESGKLYVMTVNVAGNPSHQPNWFEAFSSYLSPERDVLPIEEYYPQGGSAEKVDEENRQLMRSSQDEAIAAALINQGYEVKQHPLISEVMEDGPAAGALRPGDLLLSANGEPLSDAPSLIDFLQRNGEQEATFRVQRDGSETEVRITPRITEIAGNSAPRIGVSAATRYAFPIDVSIELGNVGGPSAGLIFSLSIIDKLTPDELTRGHNIAGTGTITADGQVGRIGGIRQKLFAAERAEARGFILPAENCAEALSGEVPDDFRLYAVTSLDEALAAVDHITTGGVEGSRRSCEQALG